MAGTHRGSRKTHESRRVKYTSIDSKPPGYGRYYFLKNADTRMTNNIQLVAGILCENRTEDTRIQPSKMHIISSTRTPGAWRPLFVSTG